MKEGTEEGRADSSSPSRCFTFTFRSCSSPHIWRKCDLRRARVHSFLRARARGPLSSSTRRRTILRWQRRRQRRSVRFCIILFSSLLTQSYARAQRGAAGLPSSPCAAMKEVMLHIISRARSKYRRSARMGFYRRAQGGGGGRRRSICLRARLETLAAKGSYRPARHRRRHGRRHRRLVPNHRRQVTRPSLPPPQRE